MDGRVEHTDVGAYVLGLLEEGDRRTFEEHLAGCARCRAELERLSGPAEALRRIRDEGGDGGR
ncbi:zf-HC2 domain-containing protein [Thermomonospora sp. CIF 1]|uniref:zf-HC2 domain-containing protein n=1 Tax=Thermomonospora sp. CIF 1 TaxID=1916083 RepID=UPI000CC56F94|nr:zf-HC2 domain-containing protein [Thermomonospora sp. CIF 1]PKK12310.1 MAG: anti-sigma factor [Thermomonospora sp. CIF 1]